MLCLQASWCRLCIVCVGCGGPSNLPSGPGPGVYCYKPLLLLCWLRITYITILGEVVSYRKVGPEYVPDFEGTAMIDSGISIQPLLSFSSYLSRWDRGAWNQLQMRNEDSPRVEAGSIRVITMRYWNYDKKMKILAIAILGPGFCNRGEPVLFILTTVCLSLRRLLQTNLATHYQKHDTGRSMSDNWHNFQSLLP